MTPPPTRRRLLGRLAAVAAAPLLPTPAPAAAPLPLFDAHVHYSHDAVEAVPPAQAVAILRKAGLKGVLVSSSDDDGTQKLLAESADFEVPSEWFTRPDLFLGKTYDEKVALVKTLYRPISGEMIAAELEQYPQSGCVFSMRVDTPGLPVNFFAE